MQTEILITSAMSDSNSKKWGHLRKILGRSGPFDTENFTPSPDVLDFLMNDCKVLVIGEKKNNNKRILEILKMCNFRCRWIRM